MARDEESPAYALIYKFSKHQGAALLESVKDGPGHFSVRSASRLGVDHYLAFTT